MQTNHLWATYASGDIAARDALLTANLSLVHHVARQLARTLGTDTDVGELVSAGTMGLMRALEAFDASRGLAFSTFAVPRIRGAMLDELRRQDHVPRSVRRKTRAIAQAREAVMSTRGRAPSDAEVAQELGIDVGTMWRWQAEVEGAVHMPLDRPASGRDADAPAPGELLSADEDGADERLSREQEIAILRQAISTLKEQERTVLALAYFEELKLHEIAEILGLTDSRVSQIRSKALGRLRETMAPVRALP